MRTLVIAILGLFLVISAGADSLLYRILLRLNRSTQHCHLVLLLGNERPTSFAASG